MASITILESKMSRLQREIKQLQTKNTSAAKDESESLKKINRANIALSKTKNETTIKSKHNELRRENEKLQKAKEKQADLSTKIMKKSDDLNKTHTDIVKERQREQDKLFKEQEKRIQNFKGSQSKAVDEMSQEMAYNNNNPIKEYDVFISHSTDDKDSLVDKLATSLKEANISIWYDNDNIGWGQSIRIEIDKGLRHSKYGIIIISPSFIEKYWTGYELDGILKKEGSTGSQMLLPIWHNVTRDEVEKYSYSIAGRNALNTGINTIDEIVDNVKKLLGQ